MILYWLNLLYPLMLITLCTSIYYRGLTFTILGSLLAVWNWGRCSQTSLFMTLSIGYSFLGQTDRKINFQSQRWCLIETWLLITSKDNLLRKRVKLKLLYINPIGKFTVSPQEQCQGTSVLSLIRRTFNRNWQTNSIIDIDIDIDRFITSQCNMRKYSTVSAWLRYDLNA